MGINSHSHSRIENSSIPIPIHELKWELIQGMGMVIPIQTQVWYAPGRELVLFLVVIHVDLVPSCSYSSFDHLMKGVLMAKNHVGMEGKQIGFYSSLLFRNNDNRTRNGRGGFGVNLLLRLYCESSIVQTRLDCIFYAKRITDPNCTSLLVVRTAPQLRS